MMGRRLRNPNELSRPTNVVEACELNEYHQRLLEAMSSSQACAERARVHEQEQPGEILRPKGQKEADVRTRRRGMGVSAAAWD
ncbi:hypothetical protein PF003_g28195 [Phytophthora fragariae]|nr:hypothetical protein PF003_g28195 [Phytophthora fragariae]